MIVSSRIQKEYRRYRIALKAVKVAADDVLDANSGKGDRAKGRLLLTHPKEGEMFLHASICVVPGGKYHLALFAKKLIERPVLRFDSHGGRHYNVERGQGLPRRPVRTPHFHSYTGDGREEAFWTCQLADANFRKVIEANPSLGVRHFCHEGNIVTAGGFVPVVAIDSLAIGIPRVDPLAGVHFPDEP